MRTYLPRLSAPELIHLLRAETAAAHGAPSLHIIGEKEYTIEENFDRLAYGLEDESPFDLGTSIVRLTVEPWVESGYWILETTIERALGPVHTSRQRELTRRYLTLDEFEKELRTPGQQQVNVRVYVETPDVKEDFDRWLAEMRRQHPWSARSASGGEPHGAKTDSLPDRQRVDRRAGDHGNVSLRGRKVSR